MCPIHTLSGMDETVLKHAIDSYSLADSRSNERPASFTECNKENNVFVAEVHHVPPSSPGRVGTGIVFHTKVHNNS